MSKRKTGLFVCGPFLPELPGIFGRGGTRDSSESLAEGLRGIVPQKGGGKSKGPRPSCPGVSTVLSQLVFCPFLIDRQVSKMVYFSRNPVIWDFGSIFPMVKTETTERREKMIRYDYQKHNEDVRRQLELKKLGKQERMLVSISCNPRLILSDPALNPEGITFEAYMKDPQKMLEVQCRFQEYRANNVFSDWIMGFENLEGLSAYADFQNVPEAAYYGCQVAYHGIYEPGTRVCLNDENKYDFIKKPFPDPFSGLMGECSRYYDFFQEQIKKGYTYKGKPLTGTFPSCLGTDGPFTIGCCLLGATELCILLYEEEEFAREFLEYTTESTIWRIKEMRRHFGQPEKSAEFGFADDSIAMLSPEDYRRFILPLHKKLKEELCTGENGISIHLCGDATRHFKTMVDELDARAFDTGFPVHHGQLVRQLGPEITISGGVHVDLLRSGTPDEVAAETRRIIDEVKPCTRNFVMKEANNLSPGTPPENMLRMYQTVLEYGRYGD